MTDDLEKKVFGRLPDSAVIHPEHGKDSAPGAERPSIPQWRARGR